MARPRKNASDSVATSADRLIEVSTDLFSRKGFKGTSIRDIARETGLTTSAIYHNFGTKGGLLATIEEQTIEPMIQELRRVYSLELSPVDHLVLLLKTHLTYVGTHTKESKIFFLREGTLPSHARDLDKKRQREIFFMYRADIERVLASTGRRKDSVVATFSTLGSVMWLLTWYRPDGRLSLEEVVNHIIEHVLHGIVGGGSQTK
jgi:TetR/AcrR family transcriptional regulator, cholesterol catabolism regulator